LPAFSLQNVGVSRGDRWLIRGINWEVARGQCAGLIGPNGSGKSTLARVLMGQLWATEGHVAVLGESFGRTDLHALRRRIRLVQPNSIVPSDPQMSAGNWVLTGFFGTAGLFEAVSDEQEQAAEQALDRVGLARVADSLIAQLSDGERVRCLVARALVTRPDLLLLDEPTAGLDLLGREQVLAAVQRLTSPAAPVADRDGHAAAPAIIMITHHIEELPPVTSDVLLLSDGRAAAQGPPAKVLCDETLSAVYGCQIQVQSRQGRYFTQVLPGSWDRLLER
jgi:iron complex transport system ATP-binding protein